MPLETRLVIGLAVAIAVAHLTTPIAIRVAERLAFYDTPAGYKGHAAPTPYLGGAAVVCGFVVAILLLAGSWDRTVPLLSGVVVLWVVGTIDDRRTVAPLIRVGLEVALGAGLWALGLGWDLGAGPLVNLAISVFWIVAVVNAFNLFDNMDGATASMAAVVAGGLVLLGVAEGDTWLAVTAAALCGASLGFLPHNLFASPARIFLGDGGSLALGFAVAALVMIGVSDAAAAWQSLAMGLLFVGIPALDTTLVMVSRRRRGISILAGGHDHLTHRAHQRLRTARAVAVTLGGAQALISALAVVAISGGSTAILIAVVAYLVGLGVAVALLDAQSVDDAQAAPSAGVAAARRPTGDLGALALAVPLAAGLAASPYFFGYYDAAIWVPAGLGLLGVATAGLIARPAPLGRPAILSLAGLTGLGVWSLASASWADSIEQAVVTGNRWLALAALVLVLLVLVRSDRVALALLAALALGAVAIGAIVTARMLGGEPGDLFLDGRLHEPLGYINGLACFFLLGTWLCLAAAERRAPAIAAAGAAGATLLAGLVLLSQSRGVALAALLSVLVVLCAAPGRTRRGWALLVVGAATASAAPALLDIYQLAAEGPLPPDAVHRAAYRLLIAAVAAGAIWGTAAWASAELEAEAGPRRLATAGLVGVVLVAAVVGVASAGRIADTLDRQYTAFVHLSESEGAAADADATTPTSRLVTGAGNRYDYWRVAWRAWEDAPLRGVGAGNYDGPYFAERATSEDIRQPHSIQLQVLSELGLIGAGLLALLLAGLVLGAARLARAARSAESARTILVASLGMVVAWLVHTSVDWIHLLPGVTGVALVGAACLVRAPGAAGARSRARDGAPRWLLAGGIAALVTLAAVSLSRQGLAERQLGQARAALASDPAAALKSADRALRLDPEAVGAYYTKAAALARFNEAGAARAALLEAARREPGDFVTWALLGDLAVRAGDLDEARRLYGRALALNPREAALIELARDPADRSADR